MNQNQVRQLIYRTFTDRWNKFHKDRDPAFDQKKYPIVYQNEELKLKPGDDRPLFWARITVNHLLFDHYTMGSPSKQTFQRVGQIFIQLFYRSNTGLKDSDALSKVIVNEFEGRILEGVRFYKVTPSEQGAFDEWSLTTIQGIFQYFQRGSEK